VTGLVATASRQGRMAFALVLGALSGAAAHAIGVPLPWMLGPMIGLTIAAMAGAPVRGPDRLRPLVIPVIGVMLGSAITVEVFAALGKWGWTFALLVPFLLAAGAASYIFYRRFGQYDPTTAYFSAMPGGLNDMLILGAAAGGEEKRIALAHAVRILVVIVFVVLFFGLFLGVTTSGGGDNWTALDALSALDWTILAGCAVIGVPFGRMLRLPAAPILGPMILSGAAHVSEIVTVPPPSVIIILAQIVIGTVIGCRFLGATVAEVGRDILLGLGSSLSMLAIAVVFAVLITALTGTPLSQSFLAYSPGGLTEMSLLALAMGQDVAYVSVLHVVRITLVIFAAAPLFRLLVRQD
jgi:uncharacterized protein